MDLYWVIDEPQFYALLREQLKLEDELWDQQWDRKLWPLQKKLLKKYFSAKNRTDWDNILGDLDVCFAPVLNLDEIMDHPHNKARGVFLARRKYSTGTGSPIQQNTWNNTEPSSKAQ